MATKKGGNRPGKGKAAGGSSRSRQRPTRLTTVGAPSTFFGEAAGALPTLELRSPLQGPEPGPSEEVMFDLHQYTSSRVYNSIDELNAELKRLTAAGPFPRSQPSEPRAKAQRLVYDAWQSEGEAGAPLARRALLIDPDCVDAHLYLAVTCGEPEQVLEHAFAALEAGERRLDEDKAAAPEEGHLWAYLPARPYLRARSFVARGLWAMGGRLAAVDMARESLELDEGDPLGLRYLLLAWYLEMGEQMLSRELLRRYKQDHSTIVLYGNALLTFWERGRERTAKERLKRALKANEHVPDRLLFDPPDPRQAVAIASYRPGSEEEADLCAFLLGPAWDRDGCALDWLEETLARDR